MQKKELKITKNKKKIVISILILPVALIISYFAFTLFMYQRLVNEGSVIADN